MRHPRYQFSLRSYLIGCLIAGLVLTFAISRFVAHDRWLKSIDFENARTDFGALEKANYDESWVHGFWDYEGRPVCFILNVFDPFAPNVPLGQSKGSYSHWQGGTLEVDGHVVNPAAGPCLFVNAAYGYTVRLPLTPGEAKTLEGLSNPRQRQIPLPLLAFWREEVECRIYIRDGESVDGQRDGRWTYKLPDGRLYLEAECDQGERHGEWTTYYPSGKTQSRQHFKAGKPDGHWEYFDEQGRLLGALDWRGSQVENQTKRAHGSTGNWVEVNGERSGYFYSNTTGGEFWINGTKMPRPALSFPLHRVAQ